MAYTYTPSENILGYLNQQNYLRAQRRYKTQQTLSNMGLQIPGASTTIRTDINSIMQQSQYAMDQYKYQQQLARQRAAVEAANRAAFQKAKAQAEYRNNEQQSQLQSAQANQEEAKNYSNIDDGTQLNSLADIFLNVGADYTREEVIDYFKRTPIAQLLKGNGKAALVNGLVELSEDLDVLANVVKAAMPASVTNADPKLSTAERLKATLGLSKEVGIGNRVNYEYDTGSKVLNFAAELVLDPLNLVELGTGTIVKRAIGSSVDDIGRVAGQTLETFIRTSDDFIDVDIKAITKEVNKKISGTAIDVLRSGEGTISFKEALSRVASNIDTSTLNGKAALKYIDILADSENKVLISNVAKGASKIYNAANAIDTTMLKIAGTPIGVYPAYEAVKWGLTKDHHIKQHVANRTIVALKNRAVDTWSTERQQAYAKSKLSSLPIDTQIDALEIMSKENPEDVVTAFDKITNEAFDDVQRILKDISGKRRAGMSVEANEQLADFLKAQDVASFTEYMDKLQTYVDLITLDSKQTLSSIDPKHIQKQLNIIKETWNYEYTQLQKQVLDIVDAIDKPVEEIVEELNPIIANNKGWQLMFGNVNKYVDDMFTDYFSPDVIFQRRAFEDVITNKYLITVADKNVLAHYIDLYKINPTSAERLDNLLLKIENNVKYLELSEEDTTALMRSLKFFKRSYSPKSADKRIAALNNIYDMVKRGNLVSPYQQLPPITNTPLGSGRTLDLFNIKKGIRKLLDKPNVLTPTEEQRVVTYIIDNERKHIIPFLEKTWLSLGGIAGDTVAQRNILDLLTDTYEKLDALNAGIYTGSALDIIDNINEINNSLDLLMHPNVPEELLDEVSEILEDAIKSSDETIKDISDITFGNRGKFTVNKSSVPTATIFNTDSTFLESLNTFAESIGINLNPKRSTTRISDIPNKATINNLSPEVTETFKKNLEQAKELLNTTRANIKDNISSLEARSNSLIDELNKLLQTDPNALEQINKLRSDLIKTRRDLAIANTNIKNIEHAIANEDYNSFNLLAKENIADVKEPFIEQLKNAGQMATTESTHRRLEINLTPQEEIQLQEQVLDILQRIQYNYEIIKGTIDSSVIDSPQMYDTVSSVLAHNIDELDSAIDELLYTSRPVDIGDGVVHYYDLQEIFKNNEFDEVKEILSSYKHEVGSYTNSAVQDIAADVKVVKDNLVIATLRTPNIEKTKQLISTVGADKFKYTIEQLKQMPGISDTDGTLTLLYARAVQIKLFSSLQEQLENFLESTFSTRAYADMLAEDTDFKKISGRFVDILGNSYQDPISSIHAVRLQEIVSKIWDKVSSYDEFYADEGMRLATTEFIETEYIKPIEDILNGLDISLTPNLQSTIDEIDNFVNYTRLENLDIVKGFDSSGNIITVRNKQVNAPSQLDNYLNDLSDDSYRLKETLSSIKRNDEILAQQSFVQRTIERNGRQVNQIYVKGEGFINARDYAALRGVDPETYSWFGLAKELTNDMLNGKKNTLQVLRGYGATDFNLEENIIKVLTDETLGKDIPGVSKLIDTIMHWQPLEVGDNVLSTIRVEEPEFFVSLKDTAIPKLIEYYHAVNPDGFFDLSRVNIGALELDDGGWYKLTELLIKKVAGNLNNLPGPKLSAKATESYQMAFDSVIRTLYRNGDLTDRQAVCLLDSKILNQDAPVSTWLNGKNSALQRLYKDDLKFTRFDNTQCAPEMLEITHGFESTDPFIRIWGGSAGNRLTQVHKQYRSYIFESQVWKDWQEQLNLIKSNQPAQQFKELFKADEDRRIDYLSDLLGIDFVNKTKPFDNGVTLEYKKRFKQFLAEVTNGFIAIFPETNQQSSRILELLDSDLYPHKAELSSLGIGVAQLPNAGILIYLNKSAKAPEPSLFKINKFQAVKSSSVPTYLANNISGHLTSTRLIENKGVITSFYDSIPQYIRNDMLINPHIDTPKSIFGLGNAFDFSKVYFDNVFYGNSTALSSIYNFDVTNLENRINYMVSDYINTLSAKDAAAILFASEDTQVSLNVFMEQAGWDIARTAKEFKKHTNLTGLYFITDSEGRQVPKILKLTDAEAITKAGTDINPIIIDKANASKIIKMCADNTMRKNIGWDTLQSIVSCVKAGYLSSPGWVMRNFTSTITKALLDAAETTDPFTLIPEAISTMHNCIRRMNNYNDCYAAISEYGLQHSDRFVTDDVLQISNRLINNFFKDSTNSKWSAFEDDFRFIHDWTNHGYADAMTKVLEQQERNGIIKGQHLLTSITNIDARLRKEVEHMFDNKGILKPEYADAYARWEKNYNMHKTNTLMTDFAWKNPWTSMLLGANNSIESYSRFFTYTWNIEHGSTISEAAEHVRKVHFDYTNITNTDVILNTVIPFINFKISNTYYWLDMFYKYPPLVKAVVDAYKVNGLFDLSQEELQNEDKFVNQLLNGALQLNCWGSKIGNSQYNTSLLFKLNGDYIDALQTAMNPVGVLTESTLGLKTAISYFKYKKAKEQAEAELNSYVKQRELYEMFADDLSPEYRVKDNTAYYKGRVEYYDKQTKELFLSLIPFYSRIKTNMDMFGYNENDNAFYTLISSDNTKERLEALSNITPSLFDTHDQRYYYSYRNSNRSTADYNNYLNALEYSKPGWAGVTQPIQVPKTYYAIGFKTGKAYITTDASKATEWLSNGGFGLNEESKILSSGLSIDESTYGSTKYQDYKRTYNNNYKQTKANNDLLKQLNKLTTQASTYRPKQISGYNRAYTHAQYTQMYPNYDAFYGVRTQTKTQTRTRTETQIRTRVHPYTQNRFNRPINTRRK